MNRLAALILLFIVNSVAMAAGYAEANKDRIKNQRAEVRGRIQSETNLGYRVFTLKEYVQMASDLELGAKIAVAGHYRDRDFISDAGRMLRAYVTTDDASSAIKAKLLQCLKATAVLGAPCPTMILGTQSQCSRSTYGYPDGNVPCINVREAWMLSDIDPMWSLDEVWTLSPLNDEIDALHQPRTSPRPTTPPLSPPAASRPSSIASPTASSNQPSWAPSFDCSKARSQAEHLICSDPELSRMDNDLAALYKQAKAVATDKAEFKRQSSERWNQRESECVDKVCLTSWYEKRTADLNEVIRLGSTP